MHYFLGVDVGSSKTHALIADEGGHCLGFGKASGGNHQDVGYDGLVDVLQKSFRQALQMAKISLARIAGAGFGVAGYDFPSDRVPHLEVIAGLGLSCPVEIVNDGLNGLLAGATRGIGVSISAGSGVNCCGRGPNGEEGRIVGNGTNFGEFGGGSEMAWKGLHMVNYAWIKRNPPTALTEIYLDAMGAKDVLELVEGLSNGTYHLSSLLAVKIFQAAGAGDPAAREIVSWAGEELGWLAVSVARQIGMAEDEVEIVESGSIFDGGEGLTQPMGQIIYKHLPKARIIRLEGPAAVGPVVLGMQMAGLDGYAVRQSLVRSANQLIGK
jgi:N-acetylglucosamine kinase-like BadF-type ATPase